MRRIRLKLTWCAWMGFITFLALWVMVTEFRLLFSGRDDSRQIVNFFSMDRDRFINLHEYQFILNTGVVDVDVVTVVNSRPSHVSRRSQIRKTFGSVRYFKGVSSATVFVLGLAANHDLQRILQQEADTYGDMIQGNFIDHDQNMTHKHVMAMYWVEGHCRRAKVIVKINDDVIVNPYTLVNYLKTTTLPNNTILCQVRTKGIPERRKGKFGHIPIEHYPFPVLPDHCQGFAYITTPHAYRKLCRASRDSRYLRNDGVYATGVLALQAHVRRHHMDDKYIVSGCGEEENIQSVLKDAIFVSSEKGVVDVDVVTVVNSRPSHVSRRSQIRKTFGSVRYFKGVSSATVFVLGLAANHDLQRILQQEADTYGDMIQGNFIDHDQNMTHKHVMAMYWVEGHCRRAKVIVKINDDVIVNPYTLVNYLKTTTLPNNTILCQVRTKGIPERRKGKFGHIPIEHYPFPVLPDHCQGFAYITTPHAYRKLCRASRDSRYLRNDGVYATGVLALQAHVRRHHMDDKYIVSGCGEEENIQSVLKDAIFVSSEKGQCRDIHELWPRIKRTNH